jgi:hypothetical protein
LEQIVGDILRNPFFSLGFVVAPDLAVVVVHLMGSTFSLVHPLASKSPLVVMEAA